MRVKPLQVYLRPAQSTALRALAAKRGVPLAELIREGVDRVLEDVPPDENPLWGIVGLLEDGPADLAEKHDAYLSRSIEDENRP